MHSSSRFRGDKVAGVLGLAFACGAVGAAGCAAPDGAPVNAKSTVIYKSVKALSVNSLARADGTYASCAGHTDGSTWQVDLSGTDSAGPTTLGVAASDPTCTLTLVSIIASNPLLSRYDLVAGPIPLGTSFSAPSMFTDALGVNGDSFNASARLRSSSGALFTSNFSLDIVVSDETGAASSSATASYTSASGGSGAPSPDYTTDIAGANTGGFAFTADGAGAVTSVSGSLALVPNTQGGESYVVSTSGVAPVTYDDMAAQFYAYGPIGGGSSYVLNPLAPSIPAYEVLTVGDVLPLTSSGTTRDYYLIVSHADPAGGPASYEVITLSFSAPG